MSPIAWPLLNLKSSFSETDKDKVLFLLTVTDDKAAD